MELNNINFSYNNTVILQDFSCKFKLNKINCILAPSGSGKSTLLNIIAGNLKYEGKITNLSLPASMVFQDVRFIPQKTIFQNLDFVLKNIYTKEDRKQKIINMLNKVGLSEKIHTYPHYLSGGELQRASLARAFCFPSKILLLDEPFGSLDIKLKNKISTLFLQLWKEDKRTVVFVTHNIDEAIMFGNYIYILSNKPLTVLQTHEVKGDLFKRDISQPTLVKLKNDIYKYLQQ